MTTVIIRRRGGAILGFEISGHCTADGSDEEGRLVCTAVSSAAYLTANTVTDVIGDRAFAEVDDAKMSLQLQNEGNASQAILAGFSLHIEELSKQYPKHITHIIQEV